MTRYIFLTLICQMWHKNYSENVYSTEYLDSRYSRPLRPRPHRFLGVPWHVCVQIVAMSVNQEMPHREIWRKPRNTPWLPRWCGRGLNLYREECNPTGSDDFLQFKTFAKERKWEVQLAEENEDRRKVRSSISGGNFTQDHTGSILILSKLCSALPNSAQMNPITNRY